MKILFLSHRIPYPPDKGEKIRSFYILKYLSRKHDVYLVCLSDDRKDLKYQSDLLKYCKRIEVVLINKFWANFKMLLYLVIRQPLSLAYFRSRYLQRVINKWFNSFDFDMVYVYSSSMAQYVISARRIRKIMDYVDVDSEKWLQNAQYAKFPASLIFRIEAARMKRYERFIAENFHRCIFVTERDQRIFHSFAPNIDALVVPNGVNLEYFSNNYDNSNKFANSNTSNKRNIVFTATMDYFANIDGALYFTRKIYPLIAKEIPDVRFYIVGRNPPKKIKKLEKNKNIIVTGCVEDVRPYLQESMVYVAPLRIARGIQNKILEAMAMGIPVVTTKKASEGMEAEIGKALFAEDDPKSFANRVTELLNDSSLRAMIGKAGRKFVEEKYNWDSAFEKLENLLG